MCYICGCTRTADPAAPGTAVCPHSQFHAYYKY